MKTLISGLNWIGDSLMAFPALAAFCARESSDTISVLTKPGLTPLWQMHPAGFEVIPYTSTTRGSWRIAAELRRRAFDRCFILPNSFRSAWIPYLAGIPERIGRAHGFRSLLLTRRLPASTHAVRHQQFEYFDLLAPEAAAAPAAPALRIPPDADVTAEALLAGLAKPLVALLPGAARGPSKRWPTAHFIELGRRLAAEGASLVIFGANAERELAGSIAGAIGPAARDLAGQTPLPVWAAALARCQLVICNDSGGMHLAAAVGTPLIALFGKTDPRRTGPLTTRCTILQESVIRSREIARDDQDAENALAALRPERVYEAVRTYLS